MSDSFQKQKRYFEVQIERFNKKPYLHKNLMEDCRHYLRVLDETGSPAAFKRYVQQNDNMVSTGKAEIKDRYQNRLKLYEKLGSQKKVQADELRLQAVESANTHQEVFQKLEEVEKQTHPLEQQENKAIMTVAQIMKAVFHLATDPADSEGRKKSMRNLNEYWRLFKEADPEASWEKLVSYGPYRNRMVFTDAQLKELKKIFEEV